MLISGRYGLPGILVGAQGVYFTNSADMVAWVVWGAYRLPTLYEVGTVALRVYAGVYAGVCAGVCAPLRLRTYVRLRVCAPDPPTSDLPSLLTISLLVRL